MKHTKLLLALIAVLTAASPMLVQGAQHVFSHPTSLPKTASDNARKALADRGENGHEGTQTGEHDDNESATGAEHEHNATDTDHEDNETDHESVTGAAHEDNDTTTDHESTVGAAHEDNETCSQNENLLTLVSFHAMPDFLQSVTKLPLAVSQVMGIEADC